MRPLTLSQFYDALRKGKGRAYLHLRRYGDAEVREALLEACRQDLRYDGLEDDRTEWVYSLLEASGQANWYRDRILRALAHVRHADHADMLFRLAGQFARRGHAQPKRVIRRAFVRLAVREPAAMSDGVKAMMDAEGLDGFLLAAEMLDVRQLRSEKWQAAYHFRLAAKRFGEEEVQATLDARAVCSSMVRRYMRAVRATNEKAVLPRRRRKPTWRQVLKSIENGRRGEISWFGYGRDAGKKDLLALFNYMLEEKRPAVRQRYLLIFKQGKLPRLDARLFEWAASRHRGLRRDAIAALSNIKHREVRTLALERLRGRGDKPEWDALELLRRNYASGDGRWIEPMLSTQADPFVVHGIGLDLGLIADAHRDESLTGCLEWFYERTPCSLCRTRAVQGLIGLHRAPLWMLREAVHDADGQTRKIAARALKRRGRP